MKTIDVLVEELPRRGGWPDGAIGAGFFSGDGTLYFWDKNNDCPLKWTIDTDIEAEESDEEVTREQYEAALAASKRCDHKWVPSEGRTQSGYLCSKCGNYDGPGYDWIDWPGGECPVPRGTLVDVRYRDSQAYPDRIGTPALVAGGHGATYHHWLHDGMKNDIIAYRLHQPQEVTEDNDESDLNECIGQDVAPEWNGEGLPPVGCECEYTKNSLPGDVWTQCTVDYVGASFVVYRDCYGVELTGIIGDIKFRPTREADKKREEAIMSLAKAGGAAPFKYGEKLSDGQLLGSMWYELYDAIAAGKVRGVKLED